MALGQETRWPYFTTLLSPQLGGTDYTDYRQHLVYASHCDDNYTRVSDVDMNAECLYDEMSCDKM